MPSKQMAKIVNSVKYWYWRKYKDKIHPQELQDLVAAAIIKDPNKASLRKYQIASEYAQLNSIEDIAKRYNVTRYRITWVLWKVYRDCKRSSK